MKPDKSMFDEINRGIASIEHRVSNLNRNSLVSAIKSSNANDSNLILYEEIVGSELQEMRTLFREMQSDFNQFKIDMKNCIFALRQTAPIDDVKDIKERVDTIKFEQFLRNDQAEAIIRDVMRK